MTIAFGVMVVLRVVMVGVTIPRGTRMRLTNEQIESNQRRQMERSQRQTEAFERIAPAPEQRR